MLDEAEARKVEERDRFGERVLVRELDVEKPVATRSGQPELPKPPSKVVDSLSLANRDLLHIFGATDRNCDVLVGAYVGLWNPPARVSLELRGPSQTGVDV